MQKLSVISLIFLFFYQNCFALNLGNDYPWYFEPNNIEQCWKMGVDGKKMLVNILDSKISFVSILNGKEKFSKSYLQNKHPNLSEPERIHGTAMAGLIAGNLDRLKCNDNYSSDHYCSKNVDKKIAIAGVAPMSKIISREYIPKGDMEKAVLESIDTSENEIIPTNKHGMQIRANADDASEIKLILLNLSGGKKQGDVNHWFNLISQKAKHNPYFLIVAAVGNDGKEIKKGDGVIPAVLPMPKAENTRDPIIRVGAINRYNSKTKPCLYSNSNYGENFVDILAPGHEIPALTPEAKAVVVGGTSEATAIVSGAVALLASCNPSANASSIKQVILDNADSVQDLEKKVKNGRVLNIYKAIENYCLTQLPPENKDEL